MAEYINLTVEKLLRENSAIFTQERITQETDKKAYRQTHFHTFPIPQFEETTLVSCDDKIVIFAKSKRQNCISIFFISCFIFIEFRHCCCDFSSFHIQYFDDIIALAQKLTSIRGPLITESTRHKKNS